MIEVQWQQGNHHRPKEHENEMGRTSPSGMDDFKPSMRIRGVELELSSQLLQPV